MVSHVIGLILEYFLLFRKQIESVLLQNPPEQWNHGQKGVVVLLPGFSETWVFLRTIAESLNEQGYRIVVVKSLRRNTMQFETAFQRVKEVLEAQDLSDVILIGHSKGGLIAKMLFDHPQTDPRIKHMISIASPYHGTVWGHLHVLSLHEKKPGSPHIQKLHENTSHNDRIVNIYPTFDQNVIPNKNLLLPGAENIQVDVIGHTRILEAEETLEYISSIANP